MSKGLQRSMRYPDVARENEIMGRTVVRFWVEIDGSTSGFEISRSSHSTLDSEAIRVVRVLQPWRPATVGGKAVRTQTVMPLTFRLDGEAGPDISRYPDHPTAFLNPIPLTVLSARRRDVSEETIFVRVGATGIVEVPITNRVNRFLKNNPLLAAAAHEYFAHAGPFSPALDKAGVPVDFELHLPCILCTEQ